MAGEKHTTGRQAAGQDSPHLDGAERDQAAEHTAPPALVLHEIIREEGEAALERDTLALIWSALAAGLSMGFSFLTLAVLQGQGGTASGVPVTPLISAFGYCVGFVIVVLGRQQLFTESTLTVVLPVLTRRDLATLFAALRLWAIVLLANLAGTWAFAALVASPGVFTPEVETELGRIAEHVTQGSFGSTFLKSVFAGWLIALMVWLLPSARSARVFIIVIITYVVSICGLSHIIAGSVEGAYSVIKGTASMSDYFGRFLIPTFFGNVLGGIALVGLLNHAAIAPEIHGEAR